MRMIPMFDWVCRLKEAKNLNSKNVFLSLSLSLYFNNCSRCVHYFFQIEFFFLIRIPEIGQILKCPRKRDGEREREENLIKENVRNKTIFMVRLVLSFHNWLEEDGNDLFDCLSQSYDTINFFYGKINWDYFTLCRILWIEQNRIA